MQADETAMTEMSFKCPPEAAFKWNSCADDMASTAQKICAVQVVTVGHSKPLRLAANGERATKLQ